MIILFIMGVNKLKQPFLMVYGLSSDLLDFMDQYKYVMFVHIYSLVILMTLSEKTSLYYFYFCQVIKTKISKL